MMEKKIEFFKSVSDSITTVVNIHKIRGVTPRYDVYIGRYVQWTQHKASIWANPYSVKKHGIKLSLRLYEIHVRHSHKLMKLLPTLKGKRLGCWCKPNPCHGDVLIKLLEEITNGNKI